MVLPLCYPAGKGLALLLVHVKNKSRTRMLVMLASYTKHYRLVLESLFQHFLSPGASIGGWAWTLDLRMVSWVFDHCATTTDQVLVCLFSPIFLSFGCCKVHALTFGQVSFGEMTLDRLSQHRKEYLHVHQLREIKAIIFYWSLLLQESKLECWSLKTLLRLVINFWHYDNTYTLYLYRLYL